MTSTFEPSTVSDDDRSEDRDRAIGAVSVRGRPVRKAPFGWLPWAALALLGVLLLATLLITKNLADDDAGTAAGDTTPTTAAPAPEAAPAPAPSDAALVAGGQALLPLPGSGLAALAGRDAEGKAVLVQSVVADEGFWVGDDTTNRIYVFLTDAAKAAEGESPFQVKAGQRVDFSGVLKPIPDDLPPFGLQPDEGAEQLRQQGHYIEVTRIALSG